MIGVTDALAFKGSDPLINQNKGQNWPVFWIMILQGLVMQHMSTHIMLYTATRKLYSPMDNRLFLFIVLNCIFLLIFNDYIDIHRCLLGLVCITFVCQMYYIICLVLELTKVLDINCFSIKQKRTHDQE
jgi:hypothetical protein